MTAPTTADLRAQLNLEEGEIADAFLQSKLDAALAYVLAFVTDHDADTLPADLREAVLTLAAHHVENREAVLVGINAAPLPFGVDEAIARHRRWSF